jgi:hypothetical protein
MKQSCLFIWMPQSNRENHLPMAHATRSLLPRRRAGAEALRRVCRPKMPSASLAMLQSTALGQNDRSLLPSAVVKQQNTSTAVRTLEAHDCRCFLYRNTARITKKIVRMILVVVDAGILNVKKLSLKSNHSCVLNSSQNSRRGIFFGNASQSI